jgi:alpha-tubulin suppressor-like RCC1 family protein
MNNAGQLGIGSVTPSPYIVSTPTLLLLSLQTQISAISAGDDRSFYLANGTVYQAGGLAQGSNGPQQLYSLGGNNALLGKGSEVGMVVTNTNTIFGWGTNSGNIGSGDQYVDHFRPVQNLYKSYPVVSISCGDTSCILVNSMNQSYGWGANVYGELGLGNTATTNTPVLLPSYCCNKCIGYLGTIFLDLQYIKCLLCHQYGECGTGTTTQYTTATQMSVVSGAIKVSGFYQTLVLTNTGRVYGTGCNSASCGAAIASQGGTLGIGTTSDVYTPVLISSLTNVVDIACGMFTSYFLLGDGSLYASGYGIFGLLGGGPGSIFARYVSPTLITSFTNSRIIQMQSYWYHTVFLTNDSRVWSLGDNSNGQLGLGSTTSTSVPTLIPSISNVIQIGGGLFYSSFLTTCPTGYSGLNCSFPMCNGISGSSPSVCAGQGVCSSPDACTCFTPSFGTNCQFSEYHWVGLSVGVWNSYQNWMVNKESALTATASFPQFGGDSVVFDGNTPYSVKFSNLAVNLASVTVGTNAAITWDSSNITLSGTLLNLGQVNSINSNIVMSTACTINGNSQWTGSTLTSPSITFNGNSVWSGSKIGGGSIILTSFPTLQGQNQIMNSVLSTSLLPSYDQSFDALQQTWSLINTQLSLLNTNITVSKGTQLNLNNSAVSSDISSQIPSMISNFGSIQLANSMMTSPVSNYASFTVVGTTTIGLFSTFAGSNFFISNSTLNLGALSLTHGNVNLSGIINTPSLLISTIDGTVSIPSFLSISGNLTILDSILFFQINSLTQSSILSVSGTSLLMGMVLVVLVRIINQKLVTPSHSLPSTIHKQIHPTKIFSCWVCLTRMLSTRKLAVLELSKSSFHMDPFQAQDINVLTLAIEKSSR